MKLLKPSPLTVLGHIVMVLALRWRSYMLYTPSVGTLQTSPLRMSHIFMRSFNSMNVSMLDHIIVCVFLFYAYVNLCPCMDRLWWVIVLVTSISCVFFRGVFKSNRKSTLYNRDVLHRCTCLVKTARENQYHDVSSCVELYS